MGLTTTATREGSLTTGSIKIKYTITLTATRSTASSKNVTVQCKMEMTPTGTTTVGWSFYFTCVDTSDTVVVNEHGTSWSTTKKTKNAYVTPTWTSSSKSVVVQILRNDATSGGAKETITLACPTYTPETTYTYWGQLQYSAGGSHRDAHIPSNPSAKSVETTASSGTVSFTLNNSTDTTYCEPYIFSSWTVTGGTKSGSTVKITTSNTSSSSPKIATAKAEWTSSSFSKETTSEPSLVVTSVSKTSIAISLTGMSSVSTTYRYFRIYCSTSSASVINTSAWDSSYSVQKTGSSGSSSTSMTATISGLKEDTDYYISVQYRTHSGTKCFHAPCTAAGAFTYLKQRTAATNYTLTISWRIKGTSTKLQTDQTVTLKSGTQVVISDYKETFSGYVYDSSSPSSNFYITSNTTLYMYYTAAKYTITYNRNNGSGGDPTYTQTSTLPITLYSASSTGISNWYRTYYTLDGWATSSTGSKVYNLGGEYSTKANATLYAHWTRNTCRLTVSWIIKGTSTRLKDDKSYTLDAGSTVDISDYQATFSGYTLDSVSPSSDFTITSNTTLTFSYVVAQRTITYHRGTGTGGGSPTTTQTAALPITLKTASSSGVSSWYKTGHTLTGWGYDELTKSFDLGGTYNVQSDADLYAIWTPNNYTVKFYYYDVMDKTLADTVTISRAYGSTVNIATYRYTFSNYTLVAQSPSGDTYTVTDAATQNIIFTYQKSCTVTIQHRDAATGAKYLHENTSKTILQGTTIRSSDLTSWFAVITGWEANMDSPTLPPVPFTVGDNMTVTMFYTPRRYEVYLDANDGSGRRVTIYKIHDEDLLLPSTTFTRTPYTLFRWTEHSDGSGERYVPGVQYYKTEGSVILYAYWRILNEVVTLRATNATRNSLTIEISVPNIVDYVRYVSLGTFVESVAIPVGSRTATVTIPNLSEGTTYTIDALMKDANGFQMGQSSSSLTAYTNYHYDWTWAYGTTTGTRKVKGGKFRLTAAEWNPYMVKLSQKWRRRKGTAMADYDIAVDGNRVTAKIYNQASDPLREMGFSNVSHVSPGDAITAAGLNNLIDDLDTNDN